MVHLVVERVLEVSAEDAWCQLADLSGIHRISSSRSCSTQLSATSEGSSSEQECILNSRPRATKRISKFDSEKRAVKFELDLINLPVKKAEIELEVKDVDDERCKVVGDASYVLNYGPLGSLLGLLAKPKMNRTLNSLVDGVEYRLDPESDYTRNWNGRRASVLGSLSPEYIHNEAFDV
mmetsp:Transcript_25108/g.99011  ORF Transcript_25108/g.99011 Transcript_25108/m.99011 type:complete len:179 (-) Transcript_25108:837-1373(-)|eukprot:CAMPEP_0113970670 /NCGR_PEP_ID=MMETSP0011_2-20120614/11440_1 /TAXON_ID=101924 /ORGANISM="Rhodosorus marinus" /LENGTH=178 /DNA_ID=CAMNT_0000985341 /DNA_START=218 /DNA_END=754 /DNA_ORIENTATION=- /assembly_acc=CAM_ASM_000156